MLKPAKWLQPRSYHAFRCIGAQCEDTCCVGWIVNVDKDTYQRYQSCAHPELGPRLRELVTIHADPASGDNYARINLSGPGCPFLSEGLCSIQNTLGEEQLPIMCSVYPRVMNLVDDVLQRSLDLSCPEAARIVLLDPKPMEFDEEEGEPRDPRLANLSVLRTSDEQSGKPYRYFHEMRALVIWLLQYRADPLWKRLVIVASLCDQLFQTAPPRVPGVLRAYRNGVAQGLFQQATASLHGQPARPLELILELFLARISSDFTAPPLLECYRKFMHCLNWTPELSMQELGTRYSAAQAQYLAPFLAGHPHILEHYLVNYVHRTLFPLGPQETTRGPSQHYVAQTIRDQCLVMLVHYGIVQLLLTGVAAHDKEQFAAGGAVRVIQSFSKAFEHSPSFPERALPLLARNGIQNCAQLAVLLAN